MHTPMISATQLPSGTYTVHVSGRYGGGYTCPCGSAEAAAAMVVRDTIKYGCGDEPIQVILDPAVAAEVEKMMEHGRKITACLACKNRR